MPRRKAARACDDARENQMAAEGMSLMWWFWRRAPAIQLRLACRRAGVGDGPVVLGGLAPGVDSGEHGGLGPGGFLLRDRRRRAPAVDRPVGPAERDRGARERARNGERSDEPIATT